MSPGDGGDPPDPILKGAFGLNGLSQALAETELRKDRHGWAEEKVRSAAEGRSCKTRFGGEVGDADYFTLWTKHSCKEEGALGASSSESRTRERLELGRGPRG